MTVGQVTETVEVAAQAPLLNTENASTGGESQTGRRSIYQIVRRSAPQNFLNAFDAPVMEINCIRRTRSTSATQALTLMNADFIIAQAEHFAKRVAERAPAEDDAAYTSKVRYAFRLAFGREPTGDSHVRRGRIIRE